MDWKDIGGKLAKAGAPIIGTALGGPIGTMIGGALGDIVAKALGTDATPEAVNAAITANPAIVAPALATADAEAAAKWPALVEITKIQEAADTARVTTVNETMRAELQAHISEQSKSWYEGGWRPAAGWVMVALIASIGLMIVVSMVDALFTNDNKTMELILNALIPISAFLSIPGAIVGVTAWGRSYEKGKALEAPSTISVPAISSNFENDAAALLKRLSGR